MTTFHMALERKTLDQNSYLEKPDFIFKIFIECKLTLFQARETSITADFGKNIFCLI